MNSSTLPATQPAFQEVGGAIVLLDTKGTVVASTEVVYEFPLVIGVAS
ncbi:hypothetical protein [Actinoallomurus soli]|nr:hypothetical protein [Actinoallomurus soli]MCO5974819.1 hypothetical protein [Actinoallomurus soli]